LGFSINRCYNCIDVIYISRLSF